MGVVIMVILNRANVNAPTTALGPRLVAADHCEEDCMRVRVDEDRCQGHGLCRLSAPEVFFAREEDGHAFVKSEEVPADQEEAAELGADSCPELAIEVLR